MTILSTHEASRIRNAALSALHYIAYDQHCEVSDILALITPSQPAPAAVTPAAAQADVQAEEVQPVAPSAVNSEGAGAAVPPGTAPAESSAPLTTADIIRADVAKHPNSTAAEIGARTGISPKVVADRARICKIEIRKLDPAERKLAHSRAATIRWEKSGTKAKPARASKSARSNKSASSEPSRADRLQAMFADGAHPTAKEASDALGYIGPGGVSRLAKLLGLTFRKVSREELSASVKEGMKRAGAKLAAKKAETALAPQAVSNVVAPDEPSLRIKSSPSARFYLRNKAGLFVHQSLTPGADGLPMLTDRRVYGWFDNEQRYRAVLQRFPALLEFRKETAQ